MRYVTRTFLLYHLIILVRSFSEQNFDFEISEDASEGSLVGKIPLHPELNYRLNGHNQYAAVDIQTGEVRTSAQLDRETTAPNGTIILILTAEPANVITVRINVLDINDNSPTFPSKYANVSIVESAVIGSRMRLQSASDLDFAENGTIVSYELEDTESTFALVQPSNSTSGGALLLELLVKLDREKKDLYVLNISARDGGSPPRFGNCTVYVNVLDANDNSPIFMHPRYDVQLNGSVPSGTTILQVEATDADIGDNGRIIYRLTTNPSEQFRIEHDTGAITVHQEALNCSKEGCLQNCSRMCVLTVEAEDQGEPKLSGRTLVYVHLVDANLHDPEINFRTYPVDLKFASISSETAVGTTVAVLTVNDKDDGQNAQITIIGGNDGNYFRLENGKNYGILRLNRIVDKPIEQFLLKFRATDDGVPPRLFEKDLKIFVLKLNETAPILDAEHIEASVFENAPVGSFVAAVRATATENAHFSLIEDDENGELFIVGRTTGIVTLSKVWPNHTKWHYEIGVMVQKAVPSDKFSTCTIRLTVIDVNDYEPEFSSSLYEIDLPEDTPPLTAIFKVTADDKDHGNSSSISYHLDGPPRKQLFMIKETSGEILLRSQLDRETQRQHRITIAAIDHGSPPRSSTTQLVINVLDVNDNEPYFEQLEYHGYILHGDRPGTDLVQLEAFDDDSPQFAQVSYLLYNAAPSFIDLDHETGRIRLAVHTDLLHFERKVEVVVGAKDSGGRLSRNNATVHLWLVESMQQVPQFSSGNNWSIEVNENSSTEKILATYSMNPKLKNLRYRINTTDLLIDELSGVLRARRSFDRETEPYVGFTIYADGEWATAAHHGSLTVLDQNDNSPEFELGTTARFTIDSSQTGIGAELFRLRCQDPDDGPNARITYSIDSSIFQIEPETGIVRLAKFLNGLNQIQFHVTATDNGEQARHSTIKVLVEIKEAESIYSFPPIISLSIVENIPLGTIITSLAPMNITQRFGFKASRIPENYPVQIIPSGEVFVASTIDREVMQYLSIPVVARTIGKNSNPSKHEFILEIYVQDVNDNVPQCPQNNRFRVFENNAPGAIVGIFNAVDRDSGLNGTVFYELMYDSSKLFNINRNSGILRTLVVLDYEMVQFYNITVLVADGGSLKTACAVTIEVLDMNDNAPQWGQEFYHFNASLSASDVFIGRIAARDLDSGDNGDVRYRLHQKWMPFKVDKITGNITRNGTLKPGHVYNLTITATDRGILPLSTSTFIFIHSVAETNCAPHFISYPKSDIEIDSSLLGQMIAQVHAVACESEALYSLGYGNASYRNLAVKSRELFWIDSVDGSIFLVKSLETYIGQRIELFITAATVSASSTVTFGIRLLKEKNERRSGISSSTLHVQENNKPGSVCGKIEMVQEDLHLLRQIPPGKTFHIEGQDLICDGALDREQTDRYRLIFAGNNYDRRSRVVSVQVGDENDNFPECFGIRAILVESDLQFIPWNCFDKDAGLNGTVGYQIIRSAESVKEVNDSGFGVTPFTGDLQHFSVIVYDRNTGNNRFREDDDKEQKTIELHYVLIPSNPGLGAQVDCKGKYRVDRNAPIGMVFGTIAARTGAVVEFFVTRFWNGHSSGIQWADVERRTGHLKVVRKPERHAANMEITLLSEGFTKTITVKLLVTGEDNSINGVLPYYEFTVSEGVPVGTTVGIIGDGGKFKLQMLNKDDVFEIDEKDGAVRTKTEVQASETYLDISVISEAGEKVSKQITILVVVTEASNNTLRWIRCPLNLVVPENSPDGTFVGILRATEPNSRNDRTAVHYTLRGHPAGISLNSATGIIRTSAAFDFEKENLYRFKAVAHKGAGLSTECEVFLFIMDRNDNAPKFSSSSYEVGVREDTAVGQVILQLEVEDLDSDNEFVYEISTIGNERGWFEIKPDGRIFLAAPLDREQTAAHQLRITVYDQRPPERAFKATAIVKVTVLDVNDNAPQFVSPLTFFVPEEVAPGAIFGSIHAIDPDLRLNGEVQYRILPWSHPKGIFMIDPILGYLQVHSPFTGEEHDEYHILVEATDYGIPKRLSTVTTVTIVVLADDKHLPKMKSFYHAVVLESVPIGHVVFRITNETNSSALFDIESGDQGCYFQISPRTGIITVRRHLNADVPKYNLTISIRSCIGCQKLFSFVMIEIAKISDEALPFPADVQTVLYVGENVHGPHPVTIGELKSSGTDSRVNGSLSYSLVQGNSTLFRMISQTGELQITESLDREMQERYELTVQATNVGSPRRRSTTSVVTLVVLDENDNAPVFEQPQYYVEVLENDPVTVNSTLLCLKATDNDAPEFSVIRYSLADSDLAPFSVDSTTGCIRRLEMLDREHRSEWVLKVTAHDNGKLLERSSTVLVRIRVLDQNDNIPVIQNEHLDIFIRNGLEKDEVVYVLSAYDLDEDDTLSYVLSGPDASYFRINQNGVITAARELLIQDYSITAVVSDRGNLNTSVGLGFYMADVMRFPVFEKLSKREFTVTEHDADQLVTKLIAQSANVSTRGISFAIIGGDPRHHFRLDSYTGELFTTSGVDYEYRKRYDLWIAAIDQHTQPMISYTNCIVNVIDINDHKPHFEKAFYSALVAENGDNDEFVAKVVAQDADSGMNGEISYSLSKDDLDTSKYFRIDEKSGEIFTVSSLDAEHHSHYHLHVVAQDGGSPPLSETVIVTIAVLDENDNSPRFSNLFHGTVYEDSPIGTPVIQVSSYDSDINSTLTYGLEGIHADKFSIDQYTGWVKLAKEVDREKESEYSVKVKAWDGLWEVRTSLTITVKDVNDNAPLFSEPFYEFSVLSNSSIGSEIGHVSATDADTGSNGEVHYSLRCDHELFIIEPSSGILFSIVSLKLYTNNTFKCTVAAHDQGFPPASSTTTVYIRTSDIDESKAAKPNNVFALLPDVNIGAAVAYLPLISDSFLTKGVAVVNDSRFVIDQDGYLCTNATFPEAVPGQKIAVSVATVNTSDLWHSIVSIEFTEPNIHQPHFLLYRYKFTVHENCPLHTHIGLVVAEDSDSGLNGRITYHIVGSTDVLPFTVDPTTGSILTTGNVDYEDTSTYQILITATDSGFNALNDSAEIVIKVFDENDNVPEFEEESVQYTVPENIPVGSVVAQFSATDVDSEPNAVIVYQLFSNSAKDLPFVLNSTTGTLYVSSELRSDTSNQYRFHVLASNPEFGNLECSVNSLTKSSEERACFDTLFVEIFVESAADFEPYFPKSERNFEISANALQGTIIGTVATISFNGNYRNKILYRMVSNDLIDINGRTGEIFVKKTWNGTTGNMLAQVVTMGPLLRNANFKPNICKLHIELKDTEPLQLLQPRYKFSLSEDSDSSKSFTIFEHFPLDARLEIVGGVDGNDNQQQPFCTSNSGVLRLCGPADHEQKADYNLQLAVIQNGTIRCRGTVTIAVIDVNDNAPSLDSTASIGYILENSPSHTSIMKLHPVDADLPGKQSFFTYKIADAALSKIFAVNESTGVFSNLQILDREERSLYVVPVSVSDRGIPPRSAIIPLRIYVDDQDDNAPQPDLRVVNIEYLHEIPDVLTVHAVPVDMDQTGVYICRLLNDTQYYKMYENCALRLSKSLLEADHLPESVVFMEAVDHHANVTFPINLRIRRGAPPEFQLNDSVAVVDLWGVERSIADIVPAFEKAFSDMELRILGLEHIEFDLWRVFLAVLDQHSRPVKNVSAELLLKQFFAKSVALNVHLKQLATDLCALTPEQCMYGAKCSQNIIESGEVFELIGYRTSFVVPAFISSVNCLCDNGAPCDADNSRELCIENRECRNSGTCLAHVRKCKCANGYTGRFCENDVDECEMQGICGNGKCLNVPGSYICTCDDNNTKSSVYCSHSHNICDKCYRGKCTKTKNGQNFICECDEGYSGRYCQLKIRSFDGFSSSLQFAFYQQITKLAIEFKTLYPSVVLLDSVAIAGIRKFHFSLALRNGRAYLIEQSNDKKNELYIDEKVNDGDWKMIRLQYKHRMVKLSLERCDEDGFCEPCRNTRCIVTANNFDSSAVAGQVALIGRMKSASDADRQDGIGNFEGCMRRILINDYEIDDIAGLSEQNISSTCKDSLKTCAYGDTVDVCSGGTCVTDEHDTKCVCEDGFDAMNCHMAVEAWHVNSGGVIFQLSAYMAQQIHLAKLNSTLKFTSQRHGRSANTDDREPLREIPCEESEIEGNILDDIPAQWMELDFRTFLRNAIIFAITEEMRSGKIELINGSAYVIVKIRGAQPMEVHIADSLDDGQWHRLSLQISEDQKLIRAEIDGHGKEVLSAEQLPTLISSSLKFLSLGHETLDNVTSFTGCFKRFIVNNQAQNFDALEQKLLTQQIFKSVRQKRTQKGCDELLLRGAMMSLEWKTFWALVFLTCALFSVLVLIFVLRIVRGRHHSANDSNREKRWKPKFLKIFSSVKSDSVTKRDSNNGNNGAVQRAVYCGPIIAQTNAEARVRDSQNSFQSHSWFDVVRDMEAGSTLQSSNSEESSVIYHNPELMLNHAMSSVAERSGPSLSNIWQVKPVSKGSHTLMTQQQSSSEYSIEEPIRRRRRRSQKRPAVWHRTPEGSQEEDSRSSNSITVADSTTYEKPFVHRPFRLLSTPNLEPPNAGAAEKDSIESESDSVIATQIPRSLAPFRPPRTIFADSENSSFDGSSYNRGDLHKFAQFPHYV